ncbi:MAG TPA: cation diffusion facilitator family transporter [Kofleriaceae bacterium]|jgi:cation diffusion facilitator family transporter|nr:cation diffusion facilitator family transporter [Kofleriaceae bacterium]
MSAGESTGEILKSLAVNVAIAVFKGIAAAITGSGAMLAETLHSFADCGNQLLLLRGVRAAGKPADRDHPFGYGRAMYFYSFIVALLLFFGGGVFSIYEGIHKIRAPEPVEDITLAMVILAVSVVLEGWSLYGNVRMMNQRRGTTGLFHYLHRTKDSDLIVVAGENSAAVVGLVFAAAAIGLSKLTNDGRWDAVGSLMIGAVLVGVATFLARKVKSLLVGEAADPELIRSFEELAELDPNVERVLNVLTLQQGPGEIVVAAKLKFRPGMDTDTLVEAINAFERALKAKLPEVRWSFIEPDNAD